MTAIDKLKADAVKAISGGIFNITKMDLTQQITKMVNDEVALLVEISQKANNQSALNEIGKKIYFLREGSARFFSSVLKNKRLYHAVNNMWAKYFSAWLQLIVAHNYLLYNRTKLKKFYKDNLGVDSPILEIHSLIESTVLFPTINQSQESQRKE